MNRIVAYLRRSHNHLALHDERLKVKSASFQVDEELELSGLRSMCLGEHTGSVKKAIDKAIAIQTPKLKEGQTLKVDVNFVDEGIRVDCYPVDKGE